VDQSALRREVAPQENLAPDSPSKIGPVGILGLQKRTEALTGDPVMRLRFGNMMKKTARSFPVSHEFPFNPTQQIARLLYCQPSRRDDQADSKGQPGQAWLTWSTFVLGWPYEGRSDK
jgi:hypothetical protein